MAPGGHNMRKELEQLKTAYEGFADGMAAHFGSFRKEMREKHAEGGAIIKHLGEDVQNLSKDVQNLSKDVQDLSKDVQNLADHVQDLDRATSRNTATQDQSMALTEELFASHRGNVAVIWGALFESIGENASDVPALKVQQEDILRRLDALEGRQAS